MPTLAYLNGCFCPIAQATVSIEDRGFQFADGVYEVVVFHGDRPMMLAEHLRRLADSCRGIQLHVDLATLGLQSIIEEGVRRAGCDNTMVYIQLTRGAAPRSHIYPPPGQPTVVMTFKPKPVIDPALRAKGLAVMTVPDFRWTRCHLKTIALLPNVMARNDAISQGFDDALFVGPDDDVREATASNLFFIRSGHLVTHPADETILPGITRVVVVRCAERIDLPVKERSIRLADLLHADEAFLCSTTIDIMPLVRINQQDIGTGRPGPLSRALYKQMMQDAAAVSTAD